MDRLSTVVEPHLLVGLAVAIALSLAISMIPIFQRRGPLCVISVIGAAVYYGREFAGFLVIGTLAYLVLGWMSRRTSRPQRWHLTVVILMILMTGFTVGRVRHWELFTVGVGPVSLALYSLDMWLLLRLITVFWEVGTGSVTLPSPAVFISWICSPFALGGPLLRYSQFPGAISVNRALWRSPSWWRNFAGAVAKLTAGLLLPVAHHAVFASWPQAQFLSKFFGTFITGPGSFYLSTAGQFHVMELLGAPCGIKLPMSFNYPIGRENISAFWANWNMTATGVFRDYLFYNRWGLEKFNVYVNSIVLFTLVGLWHAANAYWILWGFLHGLLFCGFLAWRKHKARLGPIPLSGSLVSRASARVFTYVCVCLCWYLPSKIIQKAGLLA